MSRPLWILVAGPYTAGARSEDDRRRNAIALNAAALVVRRRGHVPIVGVNNALPLIDVAGEGSFDELMMPVSLAVAARCDAVVRIGGPSSGADREVEWVSALGGRVFGSLDEVPDAGEGAGGVAVRRLASGEEATCESIMRALPEWFGIEEAILEYRDSLPRLDTRVADDDGTVAGFVAVNHHNADASEVHVIAVEPSRRGRGIGRRLMEEAELIARERGSSYMQVKTLGPSRESAAYEKTRGFYRRLGYTPLEETDLWGERNPCLILVRRLW